MKVESVHFVRHLLLGLIAAGTAGVIGCAGEGIDGEEPGELRTIEQAARPTVDLNGAGGGSAHAVTFTEGTTVNCTTADATLADSDSTNLNRMTVENKTDLDGTAEVLDADVSNTGLTKSYNTGTATLTISGVASVATYQTVMRTVTYNNTSQNPTTGAREIEFKARDTNNEESNQVDTTLTVVAVNDDPVVTVPGARLVARETNLAINGISVADVDAAADDIQINLSVANGVLTLSTTNGLSFNTGDGAADAAMEFLGTLTEVNAAMAGLTYRGNNGFSGSDTLTVAIDDLANNGNGGAKTDSDTVAITVNSPPTINTNAGLTVNEGATGDIGVAALDASDIDDADADLIFTVTALPTGGTLFRNEVAVLQGGTFTQDDIVNDLITYTHGGGEVPTDSFTFNLTDGDNTISNQSFSITVTGINDVPVLATNAGLTVAEGATGTIGTARLQVTDSDNTAAQIVFTLSTAPTGGTLRNNGATINQGGTFSQADIDANLITYLHNGGEAPTDSFNFTVADGAGGTIGATAFSITVTAVNDVPVLATNAGLTLNEGASGPIGTARLQVTDADNTTAQIIFTLATAPTNGALRNNGSTITQGNNFSQADIDANLITYLHDGSETTSDTFNFTVSDGNGGSIGSTAFAITVTPVSDPPVLSNNGLTVVENATGIIQTANLSATDVDNTATQLVYTVTALPTGGVLKRSGVALTQGGTFNQDDVDNSGVTYEHGGGEVPTDSFTFSLSDGTNTISNQTFSITVTAVNDAPVLATNLGLTLNEGATGTIGTARLQVTDADNTTAQIVFTLATAPTNGTLRNNGATINQGGTFTQANIASNLITYLHNGGETTSDTFNFTVSDGAGGSIGSTAFNITVTPVNDVPVLATNAGLTVAEGASGTIGTARLQVTDVDNANAQIVFTLVSAPINGTLRNNGTTIAQGGTFTQANIASNLITYLHNGSETTSDAFSFSVSDGAGGTIGTTFFNITVTPVNDAPTIATFVPATTGIEGGTLAYSATAQDAEGNTLTFNWTFSDDNSQQSGVNLTSVSHTFADNGVFQVSLTVTDGNGGSATSQATVTITNVAPNNVEAGNTALINEGTRFTFAGSAQDPGTDVLTFCWNYGDGTPQDCGVNLTNPQHVFDDNGSFTVRLTVTDEDGGSGTDTVVMFVSNVAPTADAGQNITANEGQAVTFNGTISDPSQADTALLTFLWEFGDNNTNSQNIDPTHTYRNQGVVQASLRVTDKDGGTNTDTILVTINNVAPTVAINGGNFTVAEGVVKTLVSTVSDPGPDDVLTYTWTFADDNTQQTGVNLTSVAHTYLRPGTFNVRLEVNDGTTTTTTNITATVTNVQPVTNVLVIPTTGVEGQSLTFNVSATEPGTNANGLVYTWNFGDGRILANAGPGAQTHTYVDEGSGSFALVLTIADGEGTALTINRTVTITNVAPVANAGNNATTQEGAAFTFAGSATDVGAQDVLTFCWNYGDGSAQECGVNLRTPTHTYVDNGAFTATLTVTDGDGGTNADTAAITVQNVAPTVNLGNDRTVIQGTPFSYTSTVNDPGDNGNDEELFYTWSVTCNTVQFPGCAAGVTFSPASSGERLDAVNITFNQTRDLAGFYTLTLTVVDKDGGSGSDSMQVDVQNEVPIVNVQLQSATINEGQSANITATAIDIGGDDLAVVLNFGNGQTESITHLPPYPTLNRTRAYGQEGQFTISATATDENGGVGNASVTLTVRNVAPVVTLNNFNGQEGVALTLTAVATDVAADTLVYTWTFGDGQTQVTNVPTVSHVYAQDGSFTLQLAVNDGTATTTRTSTVTIANVLPRVTFNAFNAQEGVPVQITAVATDVQADTLTYVWRFNDGSEDVTTNVPTVSHTFPDNSNADVRLTVRDDDGQTVANARATVANVAPVVAAIANIVRDEGTLVTMNGQATDVPADTLTFCWNFGDGSPEQCGVNLTQVTRTYANDDARTVRLTVSDEDGGSNLRQFQVTFTNVNPSANAGDAIVGRLEGSPVTFGGTAQDPGADVLTFCWDFGDGSAELCGVNLTAPLHTYNEQGSFLAELTVTDGEGGQADDTVRVTVGNVAPVVTIAPSGPANEGDVVTFTATATDPGHDRLTFCWRFGDGSPEECREPNQDITQPTYLDTIEHVYRDNGNFSVTVRVTDDDLADGNNAISQRVNNVSPSIVCNPPLFATTAVQYVFPIEVDDPGAADALTFTLLDGHPTAALNNQGRLTFTPAELEGSFNFSVRVTDDDGGFDTCDWTVEIGFGDRDSDGAPDVCEQDADCLNPDDPADGPADFDLDGISSADECRSGKNPCVSNAPAPPPSIHLPADGDVVEVAQVNLIVNNSFDPDNDPLTYTFELYGDRGLTDLVETRQVPQANPRTSARITADLQENDEYCWRAFASDGPGRSDFSGVSCFVFSLVPEAPSIPQALEPGGVARALRPNFAWTNAVDPEGQPITYALEVSDAEDATVFSIDGIEPDEGARTTFSGLPANVLEDNQTYTWRVSAIDDDALSSGASELEFFVNLGEEPPGPAEFIFPEPAFVLEDKAAFMAVAREAADPDSLELSYSFRIATDEALTEVLFTGNNLSAEDGVVVIEADLSGVDLDEDVTYVVELHANDETSPGPSTFLPFVFSARNQPPSIPTIQAPLDAQVTTTSPRFVWNNAADPEGDAITYDLRVVPAAFPDEEFVLVPGISPEGGNTTAAVVGPLPEDLPLVWQVRAVDARGAASAFSTPAAFIVNVGDNRPTAPVLLEPIGRAVLEEGDAVTFSWEDSVDPEGDAITYLVEVFGPDGLPIGGVHEVAASDDESGTTSLTFPAALSAGGYSWRVRAETDEALSAFSNSESFSIAFVLVDEPELPVKCEDFEALGLDAPEYCAEALEAAAFPDPIEGCGCAQLPAAPSAPSLPLILLALGLIGLPLVRRR